MISLQLHRVFQLHLLSLLEIILKSCWFKLHYAVT